MVRFIILFIQEQYYDTKEFTFQYGQIYYSILKNLASVQLYIYIPIWLDLLCHSFVWLLTWKMHLHSNMVRFIIEKYVCNSIIICRIYIPIWLDLLSFYTISYFIQQHYLHSNMVRFIIDFFTTALPWQQLFTFQYGQIYYIKKVETFTSKNYYLHSNMVRFIIRKNLGDYIYFITFTFQYGQIYYKH